MLNCTVDSSNHWTLFHNGKPVLTHSPEQPFATEIKREKTYEANRGTVKEIVTETARIPLSDVSERGDSVVFSADGHALALEIRAEDAGVSLSFSGETGWAYAFRLPALPNEAVFGGGEQYRQTNLRGETVVNFVSEHIKAATIIEKALLPRALYKEKPHAAIGSYAPMPVFMTDSGRLILFDTASDGKSVFGGDAYTFTFDACPKSLTLLYGDSFDALAGSLRERIPNRQYLPDWCFDGMILGVQGGTQTILEKTFAMLDAGAKIAGVWSQDWSGENRTVMGKQVWWNWEVDETLYPGLKGAIEALNARGVRFLAYINPYLVKDSRLYTVCKEKGWLITHPDGSVYHIKSTTFDAGMLDLTNPEAVRFIKDVLIRQNMLDLGVSGWMADFGEYLPVDCVLHDGDPAVLHNLWPVLWAKVNREAVEESGRDDVMFFMRSGYVDGGEETAYDFSTPINGAITLKAHWSEIVTEEPNEATATVDTPYLQYTGNPLKPTVTVKVGEEVIDASLYTLAYANNTNPGEATVIVDFPGREYSVEPVTFRIVLGGPASVTEKNAEDGILLTWNAFTWGTDNTPAVGYAIFRSADGSEWTLLDKTTEPTYTDATAEQGEPYVYSVCAYADEQDAIADVAVFGTQKNTIRVGQATLTEVKGGTRKVTATWTAMEGVSGYQVMCATNADFSTGVRTVKIDGGDSVTGSISGLKRGTTYYVRVRAYVESNGVTYYGAWSDAMSAAAK